MAKQFDFKCRPAGRIGLQRLGNSGSHFPASFGRARHRLRIDPKHEDNRSRPFRRQRQPPASSQIKCRAFPPAFNDQRIKTRASRRIRRRTEQPHRIEGLTDDQGAGIAAKLGQARSVKPSSALFRLVGPQPKDRCIPIPGSKRQHRREPGRACCIVRFQREQLMHSSPRQPAAKRRVEPLMPG